jgi:LysM repeat protein
MRNNAKPAMFLTLTMMGLGVYGCGTPKAVTTGVPNTAENNEVAAATPQTQAQPQPASMEKYVVQKGDTLWAISGKTEIYADSFQWPLIFKVNRDLIQDPDLIYPDQKLTIDKSVSEAETKNAEKLADETPKYVPHEKVRKPLPIDYF